MSSRTIVTPPKSSRSRRDVPKTRAPRPANNWAVARPMPDDAPVTNIVRSDDARADMASPGCRVWLVSRAEGHHRQLPHQTFSGGAAAVVAPSGQCAEESAHDRANPAIAPFVVREHPYRVGFAKHAVLRLKTVAADDDLDGWAGLDIAVQSDDGPNPAMTMVSPVAGSVPMTSSTVR